MLTTSRPGLCWFGPGLWAAAVLTAASPARGQMVDPLDARPTVYRAGKLPKGLPPWFEQLDTDKDGQIGLYEWRKAGKSLEEFAEIDANGDGFITFEEALRFRPDPRNEAERKLKEVGRKIDAIIYSDLSDERMLADLKPFIALGDTEESFQKKTGFTLREGMHTGPLSVKTYRVPYCGLRIVTQQSKISLIRREGNADYPPRTVAAKFDGGYFRVYAD